MCVGRTFVRLKEMGMDSVRRRRFYYKQSGTQVSERSFYWALNVCATYWAGVNSGIDPLWYPPEPRRRATNPYRKVKR
jgi:hypothetical protein